MGIIVVFASLLCLTITHSVAALEIIAFGDSITAGTGSESGGYPPRLEKILKSNGKPCTIYNLGIPGERTHQGLERIGEVLDTYPADAILIMEGTNDIRSGYPVQTTKLNLQLMINIAKEKGVIPILSTLTPSDQSNSEILIPTKYNPMIKELAEQNGIPLVDQYGAVEKIWDALNDDGIHPNDKGYLYLAKTWDNTLERMISTSGKMYDPSQLKILLITLTIVTMLALYKIFRRRIKLPSLIPHVVPKLKRNK